MLSPVSPGPAALRTEGTGDFSLCAPWSFVGEPAISLPTGLNEGLLPLALQLIGGPGRLGGLLGVAAWTERSICFATRLPEQPI